MKVVIPVKKIVKTYLMNKFGKCEIPLRNNTAIGKYFYSLLQDGCRLWNKKCNYPDQFIFIIEEGVILRKGSVLNDNEIIQFNNFIESLAKTELFTMIETILDIEKREIRHAIHEAVKRVNIYDDVYNYEAIKKAFYRYRQKKEMIF